MPLILDIIIHVGICARFISVVTTSVVLYVENLEKRAVRREAVAIMTRYQKTQKNKDFSRPNPTFLHQATITRTLSKN